MTNLDILPSKIVLHKSLTSTLLLVSMVYKSIEILSV